MRSVVAVMLLAGALLAGCADDKARSGDDQAIDPHCYVTQFDDANVTLVAASYDPIDDDRDNATNFESTNLRTCSLPPIGWSALSPDGVPHKYLGELDMRADLGLGAVAVVGSGEPGRVYIVDITMEKARAPAVLAFIDQPGAHVTDVKFSDDGKILYTASQTLPSLETVLATAPQFLAQAGFTAYNIEDPANPAYLGFVPDEGLGCHMLDPVQVAENQDAVMCISSNLKSYLVQRDGEQLQPLGFVEYFPNGVAGVPTPAGPGVTGDPTCDLPAPAAVSASCLLTVGPHDMTAYHEGGRFGEGNSYLVVSHWDEGVKLLDITDAPLITEVASWNGEGATHYAGNVHTAMMFDTSRGRYLMASPEYTQQGAIPCLWVLDANELTDLKFLAEWCHPGMHESQGLYLTTHQWQVAPVLHGVGPGRSPDHMANHTATKVYLTYNHAGVWVLDFDMILDGDAQGAILGFNLARTTIPDDHVPNAVLATWDVDVEDGYIYGTDRATGLWVWHYIGDATHGRDQLGDERLRGFA